MTARGRQFAAAIAAIAAAGLSLTTLCLCARHGSPARPPEPAVAAEPPAPAANDADGAWEFVHDTAHFRLYATTPDVPLAYLGDVAEVAVAKACELVHLAPGTIRVRDLPVYVCRHIDHRLDLEFRHELSCAEDPRRPDLPAAFYRAVPMITLVDNPTRNPEHLAHEAAHWVMSHVTSSAPMAISEGLAEYVEDLVLQERPECRDLASLIAAKRARTTPPSESLIDLLRRERRHFSASAYAEARCLVKVLVELETDGRLRLRSLLEEYESAPSHADPWRIFGRVYPDTEIEELWRNEVLAMRFGRARPMRAAPD